MYEAVNDFILKYTDVVQDNLYRGYQNRSTLPQINDWTMYYDQSINRIGTNVERYSDTSLPASGERRLPITRNGDVIQRNDGTYWLVTAVLEDWSWDGWCNVGVHMIVTPPDFSASEWSDSNV